MKGDFVLFVFLFALNVGIVVSVGWDVQTPLDEYVHRDDGHFVYTDIASYNFEGVTVYIVNMTSQKWQTDTFSTRPIWWHYMGIAIPDLIDFPEAGLMIIESGYNENSDVPERGDATLVATAGLARDTGIICAYIKFIPNQPTQFYAAKRGLDTMALVAAQRRPGTDLKQFIIGGASKRGWTTFSLAATDQRVVAQIPLVFSLLNIENGTLHQHNRDMDGGWSFAFNPYWRENLTTDLVFNPKSRGIYEVEDMLYYKERFTMPTMAMSASGDEFFLVDDNHLWWDQIPGPHYLMMLPNAEHAMAPHYLQIYETVVSFSLSVLLNVPFPKVTWEMGETENGGYIKMFTDPPPRRVLAFNSETLPENGRRDFRLQGQTDGERHVQRILWRRNLDVIDNGNGEYYVEAENIEGVWVGFFLEGEWEGPSGRRMVFTTQVNVIPHTFPRPQCTTEAECYGHLV